jgi:hypothetical protein
MTIQKIKTGVVEDNAITTSKVLDGSVTPEKLATSGILPALDGSQLIGIQSGTTEIIDDTVDPEVDTNPADGVGTLWANTTTGCLFCCTDATTDLNIWTRITVCTDIIGVESSSPFRGNSWMFAADRAGTQDGTLIYFNLSSGVHQVISTMRGLNGAPDGGWGDFNAPRIGSTDGCSSTTQGYIFSCQLAPVGGIRDILERFTFASATTATDHDSLWTHFPVGGAERSSDFSSAGNGGVSSIATNRGYVVAGRNFENGFNVGNVRSIQLDSGVVDANVNTIPSPFTQAHMGLANSTQALFCGGRLQPGGGAISRIFRFVFSNETITNNFGDISDGVRDSAAATSTETDGFIVGGASGTSDVPSLERRLGIQRISHSSGGSSIDHGELDTNSNGGGRHQSETHGFQIGGADENGQILSKIQRYAYANNVTAQEVSNLAITVSTQTSCYPVF